MDEIKESVITEYTGLEIAVIGMTGRFPGARNIDEFWDNLKNGIESTSFFSDRELTESGVLPELLQNPNYVKAGGSVEGIEYFDAPFFGYTPKEAEITDPQVRIFHECVWSALEDAGYDPGSYKGLIGLYAGASPNFDWQVRVLMSGKANAVGDFAARQLIQRDYLTLRVSYKLDLKGPSFILNTACSTSLVAIHLACQSILNGECEMALAGGVTATILNKGGYLYREGMVLSPDGHCKAFDAGSKGFSGGEGAGVVVLKRLEDAVSDRDHIFAVIKGSAINNDGFAKAGFSAPSVSGQAAVIKTALQMAGVEPESIGYVEAHGTGTELGDPVELEGLKLAFDTEKKGFCAVGSVKTNVGHMDSAAGVVGFIKAVLSLNHRLIPPSLFFEIPNPGIDFVNSPFYVNSKSTGWENGNAPLRAGVSAFGQGGTNAHVILEEWPRSTSSIAGNLYRLIVLSAKNRSALDCMTENLADYFKKNTGVNLSDVAYTLQLGRRPFKYRRMFVCAGADEAVEILSSNGSDNIYTGAAEERGVYASAEGPTDSLVSLVKGSRENGSGLYDLLGKIGRLWINGTNVDWSGLYSDEKRYRIPLPSYPFEKTRYWIDEIPFKTVALQTPDSHETPRRRPEKKEIKYPRPELSSPYVAPDGETEKELAEIWQRFFGFERIGIRDDFFELGGDSLKVITVVSRIQKELEVLVPIPEFFDRSTIEGLACYIGDNSRRHLYIPVTSAEKKAYYTLSSAQKRLYLVQQLGEENASYNMFGIVELGGGIRRQRLEDVFFKLIGRHESLRTSFEIIGNEPVQRIHETVDFAIDFYDLSGMDETVSSREKEIVNAFIRPFDFSDPPLMRVGLIKTNDTRHLLLTDMHHIITDGFSMEVLVSEFIAIYGGKELPPMTFQYKDYSEWLTRREVQSLIKRQEEFWLAEFSGEIPELNLPTDYPRPAVQTFEGDVVNFNLDEGQTNSLKTLAENVDGTLFMVLLALYNVLLAKLSGQEDIIVGIGSAGRRYEDFQQIIGMFVNTLALRNYPVREKTFLEFLAQIRERTLLAFENQDYQFEELVEKVVSNRKWNRNPLFDTVIVSLDIGVDTEDISSEPGSFQLNAKPYGEYEYSLSKFDISLLIREVRNQLILSFEYSTKLFKRETMERLIVYFKEIVSEVLGNRDKKLRDITISHRLSRAPSDTSSLELSFEN